MEKMLNLMQGIEVDCADGVCGSLSRTLVDVDRKAIAYLAVEREDDDVRLVPFSHVRSANAQIVLDCDRSDLDLFACADQIEHVPSPLAAASGNLREHTIKRHAIPEGETEVYEDEDVRAKNGKIGQLQSLEINPQDGRIENLVVTVGRIFGKHEVSIPASLVSQFDLEEIRLDARKREILDRSVNVGP